MKTPNNIFAAVLILALALLAPGCTTTPVDPTPKQQVIANAVEDTLAIGLVPVLTKNASYVPLARSMAGVIATFGGSTVTEADVASILGKTSVTPEDARVITGLVMAAWDTYSRRYSEQVSNTVRPDVKLFAKAVSNGIIRATDSVAKPVAGTLSPSYPLGYGTVNSVPAVFTEADIEAMKYRPIMGTLTLEAQMERVPVPFHEQTIR